MIEQLYETQKERVTDIVKERERERVKNTERKWSEWQLERYSEGKSIVKRAAKRQSNGKVSNKIRLWRMRQKNKHRETKDCEGWSKLKMATREEKHSNQLSFSFLHRGNELECDGQRNAFMKLLQGLGFRPAVPASKFKKSKVLLFQKICKKMILSL